jgi:hypothetical protein
MNCGELVDFYYVLLWTVWTILAYYYVLYELLWSYGILRILCAFRLLIYIV